MVEIVVGRIEGIIKFRIYMSSSSGLLKGTGKGKTEGSSRY